jgi:hypothetical protein
VLHPAIAAAKDVVIRQREKVIAVAAIPIGNHLGKVIAVAPEGVGMDIALPPLGAGRFCGGCDCGEGERANESGEGKQAMHESSPEFGPEGC